MVYYYPQVVRFDATWKCNLNCKHCQTSMFRGSTHPEDLTDGEIQKLFAELSLMGTQQVNFLGGEPLLRKNLLDHVGYLAKHNIRSDVTTNGLLLTQDISRELLDHQAIVGVSLDGATPDLHDYIRGKNTFERTMNAVRVLVEEREKCRKGLIGLSIVLNRQNIYQAETFIDLASELRVDYLIIAAVQKVGNAVSFWDDLSLDQSQLYNVAVKLAKRISLGTKLKNIRVNFFMPRFRQHMREFHNVVIPQTTLFDRAGLFECYIQCDGKVFPSQKYSEMNTDILAQGEKFGIVFRNNSVKEKNLRSIWESEGFEQYRHLMTSLSYIEDYDTCKQCQFAKTYCIPNAGAAHSGESYPQAICSHVMNLEKSQGVLAV